jgi:hypothetical protein
MTDWKALAQARGLDIPPDAIESISPSLAGLEESFRPLLAKIPFTLEPAITLSEDAVLGE